jgi:hypothetical protein
MSSLWRVRVCESGDETATLDLQAIHPDAGPLPTSKVFAFRLLADRAPDRLAREEGEQAYWDEAVMARKANEVIASVEVSRARNFPFDEDTARRDVEAELRAKGLDPRDQEAWMSAFHEAWRELWNDPDRVPSATLTIRLADPSWLAGLSPGTEWDTAAYG